MHANIRGSAYLAMQSAVLAIVNSSVCHSVSLSVCPRQAAWYHVTINQVSSMRSSLEDSLMMA